MPIPKTRRVLFCIEDRYPDEVFEANPRYVAAVIESERRITREEAAKLLKAATASKPLKTNHATFWNGRA